MILVTEIDAPFHKDGAKTLIPVDNILYVNERDYGAKIYFLGGYAIRVSESLIEVEEQMMRFYE